MFRAGLGRVGSKNAAEHYTLQKGDFQPFDRDTSQPNRRAVDGGNVSAIVLTETAITATPRVRFGMHFDQHRSHGINSRLKTGPHLSMKTRNPSDKMFVRVFSPQANGLLNTLTKDEILDLLAYLEK